MGRKNSWTRWGLCLTLAVAALAPAARAGANIGIVLDVSGEWRLWEGGRDVGRVEQGQAVTSMSVVRPTSDEGWVVIHLANDAIIKCEVHDLRECARPLALPERSSALGRFFKSIAPLFMGQPLIYEKAFGRGPTGEDLSEAVLPFDRKGVDLGPVFDAMPAGRYRLRFVPAKPVGRPKVPDPFDFNWSQGGSAKVAVPGLTPGLYRIMLLDRGKDDEPTGADALVLVSKPKQYPENSGRFAEAAAWAHAWGAATPGEAERIFLRAYLDSLTRSLSRR